MNQGTFLSIQIEIIDLLSSGNAFSSKEIASKTGFSHSQIKGAITGFLHRSLAVKENGLIRLSPSSISLLKGGQSPVDFVYENASTDSRIYGRGNGFIGVALGEKRAAILKIILDNEGKMYEGDLFHQRDIYLSGVEEDSIDPIVERLEKEGLIHRFDDGLCEITDFGIQVIEDYIAKKHPDDKKEHLGQEQSFPSGREN